MELPRIMAHARYGGFTLANCRCFDWRLDDNSWDVYGAKMRLSAQLPELGKSNEAVSEEAASLSEEGYRRADCSPPEHTCVTLSR
jgi:hypothetical protein